MSTPISNQAAYLDGVNQPLRIGPAPMPTPGPHQLVIRNRALAINPADSAQRKTGLLIDAFPWVLGHDVAGEVHSVGPGVTRFKKGDRVVAHPWSIRTQKVEDSGFALFTRVEEGVTSILPERYGFPEGVMLPVGIDTAAAGLYQVLGLEWPTTEEPPKQKGEVLVVNGGSSVVGLTTTQLATASGLRVLSLASPHNHALCKEAGASEVFDYKDPTVIDSIVTAVGKDKVVAIYDAISEVSTYALDFEMLERCGSDELVVVRPPPEDAPKQVKVTFVYALGEYSFPLWADFVPKALESGQLKCLPPPLIVGKGLESLQLALETFEKGVSGQRVVVELE